MLVTSDSGARHALSSSGCFKCHPTHGWHLAFLPQELSNPIKRPFSCPVCPAQTMTCHLTLLLVTVLTSRSCGYGPEGAASPTAPTPWLSPSRGAASGPTDSNQPCQLGRAGFLLQTDPVACVPPAKPSELGSKEDLTPRAG